MKNFFLCVLIGLILILVLVITCQQVKSLLTSAFSWTSFSKITQVKGHLKQDVDLYHSVMWIGAHPDDEMFVAGTLGYLCKDNHYQCTIVSFGVNLKMKEANMASANFLNKAAYLRIEERLKGTGKGTKCSEKSYDCFVNQWRENGSQEELVKIIQERNPEIIITFGSGQEYGAKDVHAASSFIAEQAMKLTGGNYQHYYVINTMHLLTRDAQPEIEKATDVINLNNQLWGYRMKIISLYAPFYSPDDLQKIVDDKNFQATLLHKELYKKPQ